MTAAAEWGPLLLGTILTIVLIVALVLRSRDPAHVTEESLKPGWLESRIKIRELRPTIGADLREFALLWLVFSMLDALLEDKLTLRWALGNAAFGLVVWAYGAYHELKLPPGEEAEK